MTYNFVFEIYSEEIPGTMQLAFLEKARGLWKKKLLENNITDDSANVFIAPLRVSFVANLPENINIEAKKVRGPSEKAGEIALGSFLKKHNIKTFDTSLEDGYYFYTILPQKSDIKEVIGAICSSLPADLSEFWPMNMSWNESGDEWIRPIRNLFCIYESNVIPVKYSGLTANNKVYLHRIIEAKKEIEVKKAGDYFSFLEKGHVILDQEKRREIIVQQIQKICQESGLQIKSDPKLLNEVTGMCEYPEALVAEIPARLLDLPPELLALTMKTNQRYFNLYDMKGKISNKFITICDTLLNETNKANIIEGNNYVLTARLDDAKFYWEEDLKLDPFSEEVQNKWKKISFHDKIGDLAQAMGRVRAILKRQTPIATEEDINLIILLLKFDLITHGVAEFPELQGLYGAYLLEKKNINPEIIEAVRNQYLPEMEDDNVKMNKFAAWVNIAQKIDFIAGFWIAGNKPTSSGDPFAIRRKISGVIKIIVENEIELNLLELISKSLALHGNHESVSLNEITTLFYQRAKQYFSKRYSSELVEKCFVFQNYPGKKSQLAQNINNLNFAKIDEFYRNVNLIEIEAASASLNRIRNIIKDSGAWDVQVSDGLKTKLDLELERKVKAKAVSPTEIENYIDNTLINAENQELRNYRHSLLASSAELLEERVLI